MEVYKDDGHDGLGTHGLGIGRRASCLRYQAMQRLSKRPVNLAPARLKGIKSFLSGRCRRTHAGGTAHHVDAAGPTVLHM